MRKDLFFINTKIFLPVIHVTDNKTNVFNNIEICIEANVDGIFLISHGYLNYKELIHLGKEIKNKYPSLWIGYNFLDIKNTEVFPKIAECDCEIEGIWIDDSRQGILGAESEAEAISKSYLDGEINAKINDFKPFLYFSGVAFKYCKQPNDLSKSKETIMFMTNEERELRKKFRLKLEEIADRNKLIDNHGNEIKAIYVTDVMRLLLEEDTEILELQKDIQKLTTSRMELMTNSAITPDKMVMEAFEKCRGLGITYFTYPQSIEDVNRKNMKQS